jgi:hypothetical protein
MTAAAAAASIAAIAGDTAAIGGRAALMFGRFGRTPTVVVSRGAAFIAAGGTGTCRRIAATAAASTATAAAP